MTQPWLPEREVSRQDARALIGSFFPELPAARVEPFGEGWDNVAYLVDGTYVFRFPRRQLGAECMANEIRVMPALAPLVPLPTTAPQFIGSASEAYPWPFAGYRMLPGRPLYAAGFDASQRRRLAEPLARFLAALHSIPAGQARELGAIPDPLGRVDMTRRVIKARELVARTRELGLVADVEPFIAIIERAVADGLPAPWTPVLVHSDLDARHILVDDNGDISGVIDWGDVNLGHAGIDLSIAHGFLPPDAHDRFRAAYGAIDPATWQLARFRTLYHQAMIAIYGHSIGDERMTREALTSLAHVAASDG